MLGTSASENVLLTMASNKKMQIVEWICHHLHQKTFAEMKFIDERKKRFQVPWVHKSNRRWNENSAGVFKAWAEYKGKEENFSFTRAKTNFRMAMKCQTNVREVPYPKGRNTKRRHPDDEMCFKVYEFIEPNDVGKSKAKKAKVRNISACSEGNSQDYDVQKSSISQPSTSIHEKDIPASCIEDRFAVVSNKQEDTFSFDQDILSAFAGADSPSNYFQITDLLTNDGDCVRLPSCQELLSRRPKDEEFSRPYYDTRYIPLYENISDMEVPSSDSSDKVSCGGSSDDTSGDNFSLYDHGRWSEDLESRCQVENDTGNSMEYCFSDLETWERMENALEQLFIRSFC